MVNAIYLEQGSLTLQSCWLPLPEFEPRYDRRYLHPGGLEPARSRQNEQIYCGTDSGSMDWEFVYTRGYEHTLAILGRLKKPPGRKDPEADCLNYMSTGLLGDSKGIHGSTGGAQDLGSQGVATDSELTEAVSLIGLDDVGLARSRSVQRRSAAAHSQFGDAVHTGAGVVMVVPADRHGDPVLLEQGLQVLLDGGAVGMAAARRPTRFMEDDELPGLGGGCQVGFDPVVLGRTRGVGGVLVDHGHVHGAVVEGPIQPA